MKHFLAAILIALVAYEALAMSVNDRAVRDLIAGKRSFTVAIGQGAFTFNIKGAVVQSKRKLVLEDVVYASSYAYLAEDSLVLICNALGYKKGQGDLRSADKLGWVAHPQALHIDENGQAQLFHTKGQLAVGVACFNDRADWPYWGE